MSPLPRPVKQVLAPPDEAVVGRAWVRLEKTRRVPATVRPALAWAAVAALTAAGVALVVGPTAFTRQGTAAVSSAEVVSPVRATLRGSAPQAAAPEGASRAPGGASTRSAPRVFWHGRPSAGAVRPSLVEVTAALPEQPVDEAAALLASADDAWRAGQTARAATLLAELAAHHGDDPRAGAALYLLGQMQLDVLDQPAEAVASFQRALQLGVPDDVVGPLWAALERAQREAESAAAP